MNISKSLTMTATALLLTASGANAAADATNTDPVIDRPDFKTSTGIFDVDALMACGRIGAPVLSPDGKYALYSVSYTDVAQNRSNADLYITRIDSPADTQRITRTPKSESGAMFMADGKQIAFIYADNNGVPQLWIMNTDGTDRRCLTSLEKGVNGFLFSPDEKKVMLIGNVKYSREASDIYPDLPKATGRVIDDLMYKHWDEWVTEIPHPFIGAFDGNEITGLTDIMADEPYEAPMKPFGGIESFAWTKDSRGIVYVSRKKTGVDYAVSTNSDLYLYDTESGDTRNLTEGMAGYDTAPQFSPDGRYLSWLSMERDGYEADKNRLFIMDMQTGVKTDLTTDWDYTIEEFAWRPDSRAIYFAAYQNGVMPLFRIDLKTRRIDTVTDGIYDWHTIAPIGNDALLTMRHNMTRPDEIFKVSLKKKGADAVAVTDVNGHIFAQLTPPVVEKRMVPTTDGKEMLTWIVYPPHYDAAKKYPAILYCQGGPQSAVSQFWSYRWNFDLMASNGYIMIAPNRRGVPGFGTEWEEQISKDYPGQNMQDYLSAVDYAKANIPAIDHDKIGCTGASYGGFSTYWLAGNHDHRFAAFFAHAGIFNTVAQYLETEEMWFANWDMGGAYWEKDNAAAQRTFAASPHLFVDKWDTPIMVSHGEYDFRILASQGMAAFNAAKLRGIPAEMVIFPDECHWIQKPQNAVLWHRLFKRWFDRWLK